MSEQEFIEELSVGALLQVELELVLQHDNRLVTETTLGEAFDQAFEIARNI